jgi:hypothetical protein
MFLSSNERQKTNNQKYGMTLDGRCSITLHTTTNQKHVGAIEQAYKRKCDQGGVRGGDDTIVLGGIRHMKLRAGKKLKKIC